MRVFILFLGFVCSVSFAQSNGPLMLDLTLSPEEIQDIINEDNNSSNGVDFVVRDHHGQEIAVEQVNQSIPLNAEVIVENCSESIGFLCSMQNLTWSEFLGMTRVLVYRKGGAIVKYAGLRYEFNF